MRCECGRLATFFSVKKRRFRADSQHNLCAACYRNARNSMGAKSPGGGYRNVVDTVASESKPIYGVVAGKFLLRAAPRMYAHWIGDGEEPSNESLNAMLQAWDRAKHEQVLSHLPYCEGGWRFTENDIG